MERVVPDKTGGADPKDVEAWRRLQRKREAGRRTREIEERGTDDAEQSFKAIQEAAELNELGWTPEYDSEGRALPWRDHWRSEFKYQMESGGFPFPVAPPSPMRSRYHDGHWYPILKIDPDLATDPGYRGNFLREFDKRVKDAERVARDQETIVEAGMPTPLPRVRPYRQMRRAWFGKSGQAHHVNQHAAVRGFLSRGAGATIKLPGNAFTDVGSPHYEFHRSMESFWAQYRKGGGLAGKRPTIVEHSEATQKALLTAGMPADVAKFVADVARRQLTVLYKLPPNARLPVPKRMGQRAK